MAENDVIFTARIVVTQAPNGVCTVVISNLDTGIRGEGRNIGLGKATILAMREATRHLFPGARA